MYLYNKLIIKKLIEILIKYNLIKKIIHRKINYLKYYLKKLLNVNEKKIKPLYFPCQINKKRLTTLPLKKKAQTTLLLPKKKKKTFTPSPPYIKKNKNKNALLSIPLKRTPSQVPL